MGTELPSSPSSGRLWTTLLLGALAASTSAIWIRLVLDAVWLSGPGVSLWIAAVRLAVAAVILLPSWYGFGRQKYNWSQAVYSLGAGLCLALHFAAWISSLSYTSITASTVLVTTTPLWIALLSWLLWRERPTDLCALGIGIALAGGLAIAGGGSQGELLTHTAPLGNGLALVGAWAVTGYLLLGRAAQQQGLTTGHHVLLAYSAAAAVLAVVSAGPALLGPERLGDAAIAWSPPISPPPQAYASLFALALLSQLIGHSCLNWSIRWVSPTLVSLTVLMEPVVASLLGYWLFQERPSEVMAIAALLIFLGVFLAVLGSRFTLSSLAQQVLGRH